MCLSFAMLSSFGGPGRRAASRVPLKTKSQSAAERQIADFVVVVDPVIRELGDEAGVFRDREIAVDAAEDAVIRFGLNAALFDRDRLIAERSSLAIQSESCEESGGPERFGYAVINHGVRVLDRSFADVGARTAAGRGRVLKRERPFDLTDANFEESPGVELHGVENLAIGIAELEVVADAQTVRLIGVADEALACADENADFRSLRERRSGADEKNW